MTTRMLIRLAFCAYIRLRRWLRGELRRAHEEVHEQDRARERETRERILRQYREREAA